jgi:hypothetical protein
MREPGRRRITRFVADHGGCDGRFDLERRSSARGGGIAVTCRGCGRWAECDPSQPGLLKLIEPERGKPARRLTRDQVERWLPAPAALPWWVPNAYIGIVILAGVLLVAFGVLGGAETSRVTPGNPPGATVAVPAPGPTAVDAGAAVGGETESEERERARFSFPEKALRRSEMLDRVVTNEFAIGKPREWGEGSAADTALVLFEPGGDAQLRVYFEAGERELSELAGQARRFLAAEHRGSRIGRAIDVTVGGSGGIALVAAYRGGWERALLLVANGYTYLVLGEVDGAASGATRLDTLASLGSFQPL